MIDRGWAVFRREVRPLLHEDVRRRAVLVAVVAAVSAAVVLVGLGLTLPWPRLPGDLAGVVLLALAVGVCAVAFVPLRPGAADRSRLSRSGWQMQAPDSSERYFRMRTAPTVAPGDREAVLRDGGAVLAAVVPDLARGMALLAGLLTGFVGATLTGSAPYLLVFVTVMTAVRTMSGLHRLGRVDRAMAIAATLPERGADTPPSSDRGRHPRPRQSTSGRRRVATGRPATGSKLGLPGDDD